MLEPYHGHNSSSASGKGVPPSGVGSCPTDNTRSPTSHNPEAYWLAYTEGSSSHNHGGGDDASSHDQPKLEPGDSDTGQSEDADMRLYVPQDGVDDSVLDSGSAEEKIDAASIDEDIDL